MNSSMMRFYMRKKKRRGKWWGFNEESKESLTEKKTQMTSKRNQRASLRRMRTTCTTTLRLALMKTWTTICSLIEIIMLRMTSWMKAQLISVNRSNKRTKNFVNNMETISLESETLQAIHLISNLIICRVSNQPIVSSWITATSRRVRTIHRKRILPLASS
jgi:hypothetical protein